MKKFQTKFFLSCFTVSLLTIILLSFCLYKIIYSNLTNNLLSSRKVAMSQATDTINNMTNSLLFALSVGPFQRQFQNLLIENTNNDPYEKLQFEKRVDELFNNYSDTYQNLGINYYVVLQGYNGFSYSSMDNFNYNILYEQEWYQNMKNTNGHVLFISTQKDPYLPNHSKNIYIMARLLKTGKSLTPSGVLALMIDEKSLYNNYSSIQTKGSNCFIVDEDFCIVSHSDKDMIGTKWNSPLSRKDLNNKQTEQVILDASKGSTDIVTYCKLDSSNWWLVEIVPFHTFSNTYEYFEIMALVIPLCMLLSILFSYLFSRKLSRPIVKLSSGMKQITQGNLNLQISDSSIDEFSILINGFNSMSTSIGELIQNVKKQEASKREAEIKFLQSQINPHFIYNTLNSIRCMTLMGQNKQASDILIVVIRMMRNVLSSKKTLVTLSEELSTLKDYMDIQKAVSYNKLDLILDIHTNVYMAIIPKLILQPLVENSIFHGIAQNGIDGIIRISAYKEDEVLHIIVSDNGCMSQEKCEELNILLKEGYEDLPHNGHHIGLTNINLRLKQIYGDEYGVIINITDTNTTEVHLTLPYNLAELNN